LGQKNFVVVDSQFFGSLPKFPRASHSNSEIIWLSFPIAKKPVGYELSEPDVFGSYWDDVANSLREGAAPEPGEIYLELQNKMSGKSGQLLKRLRT
jgi:hypothetical protein